MTPNPPTLEGTYKVHLQAAERHAREALNALYGEGRVKRSFFQRWRLGRAQSILMSMHVKESSNNK